MKHENKLSSTRQRKCHLSTKYDCPETTHLFLKREVSELHASEIKFSQMHPFYETGVI